MDKPFGEWNSFKIRMIGERVTVVFNGETVVDMRRWKIPSRTRSPRDSGGEKDEKLPPAG